MAFPSHSPKYIRFAFFQEEVCLTKFKHNLDQEVDHKVHEMDDLKKALNELLVEKQMTEKGIGHLQNEIKKLGDLNRQTVSLAVGIGFLY